MVSRGQRLRRCKPKIRKMRPAGTGLRPPAVEGHDHDPGSRVRKKGDGREEKKRRRQRTTLQGTDGRRVMVDGFCSGLRCCSFLRQIK